MPGWFM